MALRTHWPILLCAVLLAGGVLAVNRSERHAALITALLEDGANGDVWTKDDTEIGMGAWGAGGGGGDSITVNGTAATNADFDSATPAAPANGRNVIFQKDAAAPDNISAHILGDGVATNFLNGTGTFTAPAGGVSDGDKVDITVSAGGTTWNIDASAVGNTELADDSVGNTKYPDASIDVEHLDWVSAPVAGDDEECVTYENGTTEFEIQPCVADDSVSSAKYQDDSIQAVHLDFVLVPGVGDDEFCVTYEHSTGNFELVACGGGSGLTHPQVMSRANFSF